MDGVLLGIVLAVFVPLAILGGLFLVFLAASVRSPKK